jgi:hypothetical protein
LLICVAVGEPGKADVRFAERFAWQLGAAATVLTVLPDSDSEAGPPAHVARFLEACERTLTARGVVGRSVVRRGPALREIRAEIADGEHDLVVVGAPLPADPGRSEPIAGVVGGLIHEPPPCPVLIVRRQSTDVPTGGTR